MFYSGSDKTACSLNENGARMISSFRNSRRTNRYSRKDSVSICIFLDFADFGCTYPCAHAVILSLALNNYAEAGRPALCRLERTIYP